MAWAQETCTAPTVQVRRWSQAAARVVPPQQAVVGWVHSVYGRVINVRTPSGRILTLQGEGELQAPLALALAADIAVLGAHLPVGTLVLQDIQAAGMAPAALCLRCAGARVWDGALPPHPGLTPPVLAHMATALTDWLYRCAPSRGLVPLLPALARGPTGLSAVCAAIYAVLAPFWAERQPFSSTTLCTLVHGLVGLGEGLTPSGDDFLVGLMAVLHVPGNLPRLGASPVGEQCRQYIRLGTSQLSGEFVRCALAGHFAEPVVLLMQALCTPTTGVWPRPAAALAAVGHSSGVDAMVGMVCGCRLLACNEGTSMEVHTRCLVLASTYRDSVWLMHLSHTLESLPGVRQVAVMMGTAHNKALLQQAGLLTAEGEAASANDLLVCVQAATPAAAAIREATARVTRPQTGTDVAREAAPRTLETALRRLPDANLAGISVPGAYAVHEARKALQHGLHVFLFSAHVDLEAAAALKNLAAQQGVLLMGPDCGTAVLNGVPLGFANRLPRGPVGLIAASGTGLQQVSCLLAHQGIGISQAIGVGGRDLHERIGGHSMRAALQALAQDSATRVLVLIAKPPAASVAAQLAQEAAQTGKPCVLAFVGDRSIPAVPGALHPAATLAEAALLAEALVRETPLPTGPAALPASLSTAVQTARAALQPGQRTVHALYCGGTLAYEALGLLRRTLGMVTSNLDHTLATSREATHMILDLGAEEFAQGRPHPMIDPGVRRQYLLAAAGQPEVAVVLCDVMLGWGAHPDPAGALAAAWQEAQVIARAAGRGLVGIAHVCGTPDDAQGFASQCQRLRAQGMMVADSNAQAVRLAAAVLGAQMHDSAAQAAVPSVLPAQHATSAIPAHLPALFAAGPRVINLGLELFATPLAAHGVPVVHVDWRPPAGGDVGLAELLARL